MGATQQFSLRWNNYVQHITCAFDSLRSDEDLVDVTLSCEGKKIFAHKMLLSACSNYFKDVFKENPCKHPVIIFRNVKFEDLLAIIDFMYHGEVNVEQEQLTSFLTTAEMLAVQGLTVGTGASKGEAQGRKRQTLVESSLVAPAQDLTYARQNNQKFPSRPLGTQNPPSTTFVNLQSARSTTPTVRKRTLSPPAKLTTNHEQEGTAKRRHSEIVVPKLEAEDVEEEEEQEAILEDTHLELSHDLDIDAPAIKVETSPPLEMVADKLSSTEQLKPGPSSESQGWGKYRVKLQNWECEMCGKCFKHKDSRRQHYKSHEGSTECPICHNVLSRKYELKVHMRKRHNIDLLGQQQSKPRTELTEVESEAL